MLPQQPNSSGGRSDDWSADHHQHVLCCHKCSQPLVPFEWMCLCKDNKATHCTLKYDHQIKYEDPNSQLLDEAHNRTHQLQVHMTIEPPEKKFVLHTLKCKKCSEKVATVIKIQGEYIDNDNHVQQFNEGFVCFRPEATYVKGLEQASATKCKKWPERKLSFATYPDIKSYFPPRVIATAVDDDNSFQEETEPITTETVLPSMTDSKNPEKYYPPLLLKSQARDYQVEMYYQSLFTNSIICLPTGLGKTLVSVLLIKKMCELNPEKLVAFVVTKIPLAFQQSEYYSRETGNTSIVLCSQTRNPEDIENLRKRHVQVGFFTDGLLLNLLESKILRPEDFAMVLFDEIHHGISANSKYNTIASMMRSSKTPVKITGLTASPTELKQMEFSFGIDTVSYPSPMTRRNMEEITNLTTTKIKKTSMKDEQNQMISLLKQEVFSLNEKLKEYKVANIWNFGSYVSVVGYLRNNIPLEYQEIASKMLKLITLIEVTEVLGSKETIDVLKSDKTLQYVFEKVSHIKASYSEKVGALTSILNKTKDESRTLIFTKTKEMSFKLTKLLQRNESFQKFYPKRIVGQHGVGGMNYENEQKLLIEEFKNNECKILVSTSVLEEGIDVSNCDSVILFDGSLSLRRIVQARGRARKKNSTFYLIIGQDEQEFYEKTEKKEREMINTISVRSETSSNTFIKNMVGNYFTYRESQKPPVIKVLSFTVHHFDTTSSNDIGNTIQKLGKTVELLEWDKQSTHIEMQVEESQFNTIRKQVFDAILDKHSAFIEPTEILHSFSAVKPCEKFLSGALVCSNDTGFEFHPSEIISSDLIPTKMVYHNIILRAVGEYVLLDENSGKVIFNHSSSIGINKFSYMITNDQPGAFIPDRFTGFKVYYIKLNHIHEMDAVKSIISHDNNDQQMSSTISYYLSYIQDRHPMVFITPLIINTLKEELERLLSTTDDTSFSATAFSMSSFVVDVCKLLDRCTFASESTIVKILNQTAYKLSAASNVKYRFIRCLTHSMETIIVELPQLVDDKRFFRKLGTEDFIKVKIIGEVPPVIDCCGKRYCPLGGSMSMLRGGFVFFFDKSKYESASAIMQMFGTYSDTSFKLVSRHALNFTTTTETCKITKWKCVSPNTDEDPLDPRTTDGIGKISYSKAREVSMKMGLQYIPTAFQIRFLGFKGVLTVLPDEDMDGMEAIFRDSMRKFEGNPEFNMLEIVSCSSPRKTAYLNKQIILLLLSLGISFKDNFFLDYFRDLSNNIANPEFLLDILKDNCIDTLPAVQYLEEMPDDEFLQNVAKYLTYKSIKKVQSKAMIPIEKAIIAMSIVDEYRQLKEDEVMIQLGNGQYLPDGTKVFICRNPCLHPSDIQIFTARTQEVLMKKYQSSTAAVIFPTTGLSATKICDFDGDRVFVCWDERLVPDHVSNLGPRPLESSPQNTIDLCDTLTKILENGNLLGKISDGWVAITDSCDAADEKALHLADLFVEAVDFPKKGNEIVLPAWFKDILFPDFMERDNNSIKSHSILGRIYQKCITIKNSVPIDFVEPEQFINNDKLKECYCRFWKIVEYLKQVHQCSIFDLIAGDGVARKEFTKLIEQFREIVREEDCKPVIQNLALSNIFSLTIPSVRKTVRFTVLNVNKKLSESISTYLVNMPIEQLEMMEKRLENLRAKTEQKFKIHMFGSLPVLLHQTARSDCDTFINFDAEKGDEKAPLVCSGLSNEFESSATDWHASVPMFRIFVKTDIPFIESIDFTNSVRGLRKKHHLRLYLEQKPQLIILLKILIEILRKVCPHIKTYQFVWKIIQFCIEKSYLRRVEPPSEKDCFDNEKEKDSVFMKRILSKCLQSANDFCVEASHILCFLRTFTFREKMEFVDSLDSGEIATVTMDLEQTTAAQDMLESCVMNLYLLPDFSKLSITEKEEVQVYLPNLLRKVLGNVIVESRLKQELEKTCNCKITNIIEMKGNHYIVNATGEHGVGTRLKQKLALWNTNCKYFRAKNQRLFLDGSTATIFQDDSMDIPIEFIPYEGKCNPKHALESITKHKPKLKYYKETDFPIFTFYQQLVSQMSKMEVLDFNPCHFTYSVKFGTYYIINKEKSIFSEIVPQDSQHYNSLMKKNQFKSIEVMKKEKEKEVMMDNEEEMLTSTRPETKTLNKKQHGQKEEMKLPQKNKPKKAPSDSFLTLVKQEHIMEVERLLVERLDIHDKQVVTDYSVCIVENDLFEYKVKLDHNLKFNQAIGVRSYHTRIMATTFIGKSSDMRFYINHSQYVPTSHKIFKIVNRLNEHEWIIKEGSSPVTQITFHQDLPLVNTVRKAEKSIYRIIYSNQPMELTILKVSFFTKKLSSLDQTLDLTSEHYEFKVALPKSDNIYSPYSGMALLACGMDYWKLFNNSIE